MTMNPSTMFKLTYGLFVITAKEEEKDNGCITNTVAQITSTPNRISLTVNKLHTRYDSSYWRIQCIYFIRRCIL